MYRAVLSLGIIINNEESYGAGETKDIILNALYYSL
jgi:hypothetical protein